MKTNSSRQKNGSNDGLVAIVPATRATRISFLRSYQFSHSFISRRFNIAPERNRTTHKPASNLTGGYLHRARLYSRLSQGRRQSACRGPTTFLEFHLQLIWNTNLGHRTKQKNLLQIIKTRDPVKAKAGSKRQSGKGEGPRDQQQRRAIIIVFREEVRGRLFLGTKWPNRHRFRGKDLAGEEEKKCHNGTLLCIISLNLTNPAGASGEETRVRDSAGLSPWAGAKQRGWAEWGA